MATTPEFTPVRGLLGVRIKILPHIYKAIYKRTNVMDKCDFTETEQDPVYICYQWHGLRTRVQGRIATEDQIITTEMAAVILDLFQRM